MWNFRFGLVSYVQSECNFLSCIFIPSRPYNLLTQNLHPPTPRTLQLYNMLKSMKYFYYVAVTNLRNSNLRKQYIFSVEYTVVHSNVSVHNQLFLGISIVIYLVWYIHGTLITLKKYVMGSFRCIIWLVNSLDKELLSGWNN